MLTGRTRPLSNSEYVYWVAFYTIKLENQEAAESKSSSSSATTDSGINFKMPVGMGQ